MFGRIIVGRRYIKIILLAVVLIPLLHQLIVLITRGKEHTGYNIPKLQDKVPTLQGVNDYFKNIGNSAQNATETPDDIVDAGEPVVIYPDVSDPEILADLPYLKADGSLNKYFFSKFVDHDDNKKARKVFQENNRLYADYIMEPIDEPKVDNLQRPSEDYKLANATLLSLVRNSELDGILSAMEQVEAKFNSKFHYPWTFMNDVSFSKEFKTKVKAATESEVHFITIPKKLWKKPIFIDKDLEQKNIDLMLANGVGYADMESYHNMCRFYSGTFYNIPHLQQFKYYWRVEPDTKYFCDIDYDVFKFMQDNNKSYGFNINLYDGPSSITKLWNTTMEFLEEHPKYLNPNGAFQWLLEDMQNPEKNQIAGYSTCHFWSNFEIADMDFFRGEAYSKWFEHLDNSGGFYYERWGDAPVHAIGLGLFEDKSRIHFFRDIGYHHMPFTNCPNSDRCDCEAGKFVPWFSVEKENCMANWVKYGMSEDEKNMF
ncbi:putative mannosyltransferase [Saccharomycopsis crataegensis]|uniref:Mannosyltransferase n=1 Tax=Saccharomycopsis crataegensis TaxID=43959 RepID=A0AAV5QT28_9ASCO|nr:putative mannosyltransferase [Saccharomycopsis crataegensis]